MSQRLNQIRCFLLDMDGTFYLGDKLIDGALELMGYLLNRNKDYLFLTNNSSKSTALYLAKIKSMGFDVPVQKVFTSGEATTIFLKRHYPGAKVFLVGTEALAYEFELADIQLVEQDARVVVLGFDTTITYEKLWRLCDQVRAGLPYIATHPDLNCPTESGYMPDTGSFIALVEASTGRTPDFIIGKPNQHIVDAVIEKTGFAVDEIAMVGDRLYTDIALGKTGITTVLTLSGETKLKDVQDSLYKPDYIVKDLRGLLDLLKK